MLPLNLFLTEGVLLLLAILVLALDWYVSDKKILGRISIAAMAAVLLYLLFSRVFFAYTPSYNADGLSFISKIFALSAGILALLATLAYKPLQKNIGELFSLIIFSCLGVILVASSVELILIYIALEFVSLTSYVMAGYLKDNPKSSESGMKYFLFGAAVSAIMLYGMSLIYAASSSTNLTVIFGNTSAIASPVFILGSLLMLIGFGFKIAMVPVHFWVPDVYEGSPTPIVAFFSAAPKIAGFAIIIRLLLTMSESNIYYVAFLSLIAALTMTVANLAAIAQNNVKRLFGYSSIAQAGYIIIALAALGSSLAVPAVFIYLLAYILATMGAFAVIIAVSFSENSDDITAFNGLSERSPFLSACMVVFLLSLVGIPPLAGFIGKLFIFAAAIDQGLLWLAILGVVNSVISLYYYFRIVRHMYLIKNPSLAPINADEHIKAMLIACLLFTLYIGIFPQVFIKFMEIAKIVF